MAKRRDKNKIQRRNEPKIKRQDTRQIYLICALLILATLAVYWQVGGFGFINCDDNLYVQTNPWVKAGLHLDGVKWAFTSGSKLGANWMPMVWMSLMLDSDLSAASNYGSREPDPQTFHITNLLLHIANVLLLFLILYRMTGYRWRSAFVAALFAIHPLHVESVAWIAERKDVLSTFFWLTTMLAYLHYAASPNTKRYLLVTLSFVVGLMSKSMLVTLPFVLLLLDYWPLKRIGVVEGESVPDSVAVRYGSYKRKSLRRMSIVGGVSDPDSLSPTDSAPAKRRIRSIHSSFIIHNSALLLLPLSFAAGITAIFTQRSAEGLAFQSRYPIGVRLANAAVSYVVYIFKMIWPTRLAFMIPHPGASLPMWQVMTSALLILLITSAVILIARRKPYITVGWFWYLITLIPVIGIVQIGNQALAYRYTYIPLIGLFIIIAWGIPDLLERLRINRVAPILACIAIFSLMISAYIQVGYWRNSATLFRHTINIMPSNSIAHANLGFALWEQDNKRQAEEHFRRAIELDNNLVGAHVGLGYAMESKGSVNEAMKQYSEAIRLEPNNAQAHNNLAVLLEREGKLDEALTHFEAAARICPDNEIMRTNADMLKKRIEEGQ